ncbi:hypothetical protein LTS17_001280 [Exophiala oligosperma]
MATTSNLCQQLGINHPLEQATCIGYAIAKPTCGNAVARGSRSEAAAVLKEIARKLTDGIAPTYLIGHLERVASLLHCKRNHQDQAPAKARTWQLNLVQATTREPRRRQHSEHEMGSERGSTAGRRRQPSTTELLRSCRTKDLLAEVSNRLSRRRRSSTMIEAIEALMDKHYEATGTEPGPPFMYRPEIYSESSTDEDDDDDSGFYGSRAQSEDMTDGGEPDDDNDNEPLPSLRSPSPRRRGRASRITSSIRGSVNASQHGRSHSPSPSVQDVSPPTRLASSSSTSAVNECGICLTSLDRTSEIWSCGTCRNSAHVDCFDSWVANSPDTNMKCIYW